LSRLRLTFVLSLIILAGVFISIIYLIPSGQDDIESNKAQVIEEEGRWILQYDIINNEDKDINYTIYVTVDDAVYKDSTVVKQGKKYTYIRHIHPEHLEEGKVTFILYEEGKTEPIEEVTYYIGQN
jgi:hypothetical protein